MKYAALNSTNSAHERDKNIINWSDVRAGFRRSRHKGNITLRQILKKKALALMTHSYGQNTEILVSIKVRGFVDRLTNTGKIDSI